MQSIRPEDPTRIEVGPDALFASTYSKREIELCWSVIQNVLEKLQENPSLIYRRYDMCEKVLKLADVQFEDIGHSLAIETVEDIFTNCFGGFFMELD